MILAMFVAFQILAADGFDAGMTPQDKKNTGVSKLSDKEKTALQQWIDSHYQKKVVVEEEAMKPHVRGSNPVLSENLMNSQYLRLSDDTLWNIRPEDVPIAQGWITPVEIVVSKSSNPFFPFKLTNKVSGSSVLARKAEKLPQPGSPPLAPKSEEKIY